MIAITNVRILDPVTRTDCIGDVLIKRDAIFDVGPALDITGCVRVIDGTDLVLSPGLVDTHVHFRDPGLTYKEDIFTGADAAKQGGFTTVVMMANTKPTISTPELLEANLERGRQTGIHVLQAASVTRDLAGKELTDMPALAKAGAAGFTDDGIPIMDEGLLRKAMETAAALDLPISLHEEDPAFIASPGVNAGPVADALGVGGASALAEEVMVARDCEIARDTGARVIIQHISSGRSVAIVRQAKKSGAKVFAEATPHHFTLTEKDVLIHGTYARMNPPLRTEADRLAIIQGLMDGTIDVIATDHAPHSAEEKALPFAKAPSGIIGLETSLALGITTLVRGGYISLMELMDKMSAAPARLYHLNPQGIAPGAPADLVLYAPEESWVVEGYSSKAINSPFTGQTLYGKVYATICDGNIVYEA